jgi:hypothetical protein
MIALAKPIQLFGPKMSVMIECKSTQLNERDD